LHDGELQNLYSLLDIVRVQIADDICSTTDCSTTCGRFGMYRVLTLRNNYGMLLRRAYGRSAEIGE
jgi:hypothetical protein